MLDYIAPMYDPLIAVAPDGSLSRDGIVTAWQFNAAGDQLTLKIRQGVKFHNGDQMTAADVKFSLETFSRPGQPVTSNGLLRSTIASVDALDNATVLVHLKSPDASLLNTLAWLEGDVAVIPQRYFESLPGSSFEEKTKAFEQRPIATGPFRFVKRDVGRSIEFQANHDYFDSARVPKIEHLILLNVPNQSTRTNMLLANEADIIETDATAAAQLASSGYKGYVANQVVHGSVKFLASYKPEFVTHDVRIRKALTLAIDREAMVRGLFPTIPGVGPTGTVAKGPALTGPGIAGYRDTLPSYPYDPSQAKQLLKDAGYLDNPKTIRIWSYTYSALPAAPAMLNAVAQYWTTVGVKVDIRPTDSASVIAKYIAEPQPFFDSDVDMTAASWRPTGLNNLRVFATSKKLGTQSNSPLPEKFDDIVTRLTKITDAAKFDRAMADMWADIYNDYWAIPIVWANKIWMANPKSVASFKPIAHSADYIPWEGLIPAGS